MTRLLAGALALLCLCLSSASSRGNDLSDRRFFYPPGDSTITNQLTDHSLQRLSARYQRLNSDIQEQTASMLRRMQAKELSLQQRLRGQDSLKARVLFADAQAKYQRLLAKLRSPVSLAAGGNPLKQYIPGVDSMQTALRFLGQVKPGGLAASGRLQQLQGTLQNANEIQAFVRQREQQLQEQLMNSHVARQLLGINKTAYYYQAQLAQYKDLLNQPDKLAQRVLAVVRQAPAFQRFWQQNSYFSRLFPAPDPAVAGTAKEVAGLQTRDLVQKEVQGRLGLNANSVATEAAAKAANSGGGGNGLAYLQQKIQTMEAAVRQIKADQARYGSGSVTGLGGGPMTMPNFQPNTQHNKTFLQRLQFSFVIQNSPSTSFLPATSSLGLNIGYRMNDKMTAGIGGSYLLGLGYGLNHIQFTNQGVGVRSFLDVLAKGSLWITGGFEYNYRQQFTSLQNIPHLDIWQKSALIGLTKKYRLGKRENTLQLLYDFLANSEVPRGQPIQFRLGWGL